MRNWKAASWPHYLIFSLIFFASNFTGNAADSFSIAPPATWIDVQKLPPDLQPITNSTDENVRYTLLDDQVNAPQNEHYRRVVREVANPNGVQDCVQLSMDFDPSYQTLTIHDISIHRGTNVINCLQPEKIKVIQQERDLDMNLYNGQMSAVLFLEDVRVGDQIDYSYTVHGSNPIFAGHYMDAFNLQWGDAVASERFRLLWPTNRFLAIKNHSSNAQPVIRQLGNLKEYLWELHDLPAISEEDLLPSWYNPWPWIQFSDFASWREVAQWAVPLYPSPAHLDPKLQEKISEWQKLYPSPEERMSAALAFVQDEIRYMGIEVGPNSHQPNDPSLVFARRFGDCKDKAYLFCTLLHAMNIDACEILVDTEDEAAIKDWLPSPYAFNHVVTRVRLDGKTYWLDPTEVNQGGAINDRFFPNYGYCLLVRPETKGLTAIPQQLTGWPKTTVQETFVVHGKKDPAELTIRTLAEGSDADQLRETFADQRRDELQKNYLNYYAREYPKIKTAAALEVFDHREENTFETVEHYQIHEFWTLSDDKQNYECDFYPQTIRDLFDDPTTTLRSMPLAITYPRHTILRTTVLLPDSWPLTNEVDHFESTAAQLDFKRETGSNSFQMVYEYRALTNFVSPDDMPSYMRTLEKMKNALGYSLQWANDDAAPAAKQKKGGVNWTIVALGAIYLVLLIIIAISILRFLPKMPPVLPGASSRISGLGGWLILPAIRLFVGPLVVIFTVVSNASVFAPETWHSLTDPSGSAYNGYWAPVLIYEYLVNLTTIVFDLFLLILFFQKRHAFPRLYVTFLVFVAATTTVDNLAALLVASHKDAGSFIDKNLIQTYSAHSSG